MSQNNVRPGDRAIIVKAIYPENQMMVVEVIRQLKPGVHQLPGHSRKTKVEPSDGVVWEVESLGRPFTVYDIRGRNPFPAQISQSGDWQLRRLPRPDETPEDTSVEDRQPVEAS